MAYLMNIFNDLTVEQIIYETNMVKKEWYDLAPSEIQHFRKLYQSLWYNPLGAREPQNQEGK